MTPQGSQGASAAVCLLHFVQRGAPIWAGPTLHASRCRHKVPSESVRYERSLGMESASAAADPAGAGPGEKGLKTGAIGYLSNLVISVASVAPAYSLAATLGFVTGVAGVGLGAPAVMIASFVPMLLIAAGYYYL